MTIKISQNDLVNNLLALTTRIDFILENESELTSDERDSLTEAQKLIDALWQAR